MSELCEVKSNSWNEALFALGANSRRPVCASEAIACKRARQESDLVDVSVLHVAAGVDEE